MYVYRVCTTLDSPPPPLFAKDYQKSSYFKVYSELPLCTIKKKKTKNGLGRLNLITRVRDFEKPSTDFKLYFNYVTSVDVKPPFSVFKYLF